MADNEPPMPQHIAKAKPRQPKQKVGILDRKYERSPTAKHSLSPGHEPEKKP